MVVFDSSALLVVLLDEAGADAALERLPDAVLTATNLAEVYFALTRRGVPLDIVAESVRRTAVGPLRVSEEIARVSASFPETAKAKGLSLGDRICIAAAKVHGVTAITADRAWTRLGDDVGCDIYLLR